MFRRDSATSSKGYDGTVMPISAAQVGMTRPNPVRARCETSAWQGFVASGKAPGRLSVTLRQRRLEPLRGQRSAAEAHAGRVEDGVGDGGDDRADRALARTGRR
jgi:hypothetical protein